MFNERKQYEKVVKLDICPKGTTLKNNEGGSIICENCPKNAICEGGYIKPFPKPYYSSLKND